jgi:charged multivesicular body protein 2A
MFQYEKRMGSQLSIETQIDKDIRLLRRQGRKLEREINRMGRENVNITYRIKRYASEGNIEMVKALSREYIIYKNNIVKLTRLKGQMSNIQQRIHMMKTNHEINKALVSLTQTMKSMNRRMGLVNIQNIITEFEMETTKAESISEVLDDALTADVDEDEEEELVDSVLDEIGVSLAEQLVSAPANSITPNAIEQELESRYRQLTT